MIRFEGVTKQYAEASGTDGQQGTVAVDDLTLEAPTGKITVLVGPSGCGKTTTLRMVNRMIEPTSGHDLARRPGHRRMIDVAELRRGIGYVIQHAGLFPHRTVLDNVAHRAAAARLTDKTHGPVAGHGAARAGRPRPGDGERYPAQLSGGQQQRVGVARALAADPPVMLMDEPFSAVDPVVREQLQDEFLRLQSELGKTIVFVTHDIDEAIKLGDQVAVLRVGRRARPAGLAGQPARPPGRRLRRRLRRPRPRLPRAVLRGRPGAVARPTSPRCGSAPRADDVRAAGRLGARASTTTGEPLGLGRAAAVESRGDARRCCTAAAPSPRRPARCAALLDAALSSPSGRGVVVDDDGRLVGTIRAAEVLTAIEDADGRERRRPGPSGATAR